MWSVRLGLVGSSAGALSALSVMGSSLVAVPAAGVGAEPASAASGGGVHVKAAAAAGPSTLTSSGAARPVTPKVREVPVRTLDRPGAKTWAALSAPQAVDGYGVVGATWQGESPKGLRLAVRTGTDGRWSRWRPLHEDSCPDAACVAADHAGGHLDGGHGPEPSSAESSQARAGTDPLAVGEVDVVQLRASSAGGQAPTDLELSVIDPGRSAADMAGGPATTGALNGSSDAQHAVLAGSGGTQASAVAVASRAADTSGVRAPRPRIRTRRVWGADERLRTGASSYGRVRAAFVHHTVNANRYARSDVPAIIRGIYAYHTQSRGWSDIGYNFLVDRFGRIWMGRDGGRHRAVIGAHTYGYNDLSTGAAAIGDFETRKPSLRMKRAFGRLLGWKLGRHGVPAGRRRVWMDGHRFRAINGHRDAGQTACPGNKLYRSLDDIRRLAVRRQQQ
jgi:hypothetical protein